MSRRYRMSRRQHKKSYHRGLRTNRKNLTISSFSRRGGARI